MILSVGLDRPKSDASPRPRNKDHHSTPEMTVPSDLPPDVSPLTTSRTRTEDEFQTSQIFTPLPSASLPMNKQSQRDSTSPSLPMWDYRHNR